MKEQDYDVLYEETYKIQLPNDEFRVTRWDDYIGQSSLKKRLDLSINSALRMERLRLDHMLFMADPGYGKTTLAALVARRFFRDFQSYIMPLDEFMLGNIVAEYSGVLLLDEIHRASTKQQEQLLPLIEDGFFQCGHIKYENSTMTVIAATTEPDKVIEPLKDRFMLKPTFDPYTEEQMGQIVEGMMIKASLEVDKEYCRALGRAAGNSPRLCKKLVIAVRDLHHAYDILPSLEDVFLLERVTPEGLSEDHIRYLNFLKKNGTIGVEHVVNHLSLTKTTVLRLEKLLVQKNMIAFTKKGRTILSDGLKVTKEKPIWEK